MSPSPRTPGSLRRNEIVGGLLYLPMFLIGTPMIAAFLVMLFAKNIPEAEALAPCTLVYTGLNALALCLIFRRYLVDQSRQLLRRGWWILADLALGFLVYYGLAILASTSIESLQMLLKTDYSNANQKNLEALLASNPILTMIGACVLAPIGEELLFRGLIFCGLHRRSRPLAYVVSMLSFALVHVMSSIFHQPILNTLVVLPVYLPHGFALAWVYERSSSIWCSVFLHMLMNTVAMLVLPLIGQIP